MRTRVLQSCSAKNVFEYCPHSIIRCTVYGVRCRMYGVRCAVHGVRRAVHGVRCTVYGVRCMKFGVRCAVHGARCTVMVVVAATVMAMGGISFARDRWCSGGCKMDLARILSFCAMSL